MLSTTQKQWIENTAVEAEKAGHIFPSMAACEAALESSFGLSLLARIDNNLFGMKQHAHPVYGTHNLPTKEFLDPDGSGPQPKQWVIVNAAWVSYPSISECFADRMNTLRRLEHAYPHYAAALSAKDAETFVKEVSQTWSTDPTRAIKVISIHDQVYGAI